MGVSIILPTFNRAQLLADALASLVSQDYSSNEYEIVVVDNASKDSTREIVADFQGRYTNHSVRYIYEPRPGLVWARHAGVRAAIFDILAFTDDDGLLAPCWLKEIARIFSADPRVAAVAGRINIRWDVAPPAWVLPYEGLLGKLDYGSEVLVREGLFINGGNFSIRKEVLAAVGGFNPDQVGDRLIGDGETGLCHKLHARNCLIGWSPLAVMEHRQFAYKHATVADIRRRFANNGVGVPYHLYAIERKGGAGLLANLVLAGASMGLRMMQALAAAARRDVAGRRRAWFELDFFAAQFPYTLRIFFSPSFRRELRRDYWLESAVPVVTSFTTPKVSGKKGDHPYV